MNDFHSYYQEAPSHKNFASKNAYWLWCQFEIWLTAVELPASHRLWVWFLVRALHFNHYVVHTLAHLSLISIILCRCRSHQVLWHCWLGGRKGIWPVKNMGGWWRWALVSPDGVAHSRMVVCLPLLHHKVQKFSSGTGSPGWSRKRAIKRLWCGVGCVEAIKVITSCGRGVVCCL